MDVLAYADGESHQNNGNGDSGTRVLMIDLENCPAQVEQLMKNLEAYSHVVICYAESNAKIPIDWIMPITATINANKLKIIKMPRNGKNAADFGISFWAGVLMAEMPPQAEFFIVSNDTDLEHVVGLLKSQNRVAERIGTKKEEKPPMFAVMEDSPVLREYCEYLVKHGNNRPSKPDTLIKSIRTKFKENISSAEGLLDELRQKGAISILDSKISYNDKIIRNLAKG